MSTVAVDWQKKKKSERNIPSRLPFLIKIMRRFMLLHPPRRLLSWQSCAGGNHINHNINGRNVWLVERPSKFGRSYLNITTSTTQKIRYIDMPFKTASVFIIKYYHSQIRTQLVFSQLYKISAEMTVLLF